MVTPLVPLNLDLYRKPVRRYTPNRRKRRLIRDVLKRARWKCEVCLTRENLTLHHRVPRSEGGADCRSNLQVLCVDCHVQRHPPERGCV